jgi:hypothetical protein
LLALGARAEIDVIATSSRTFARWRRFRRLTVVVRLFLLASPA